MLTLGFRVIRTVGEKITKLKPSKGFAAEMSRAIVVLLGSISGIPLSTTHTLVGAVIGIGIFIAVISIIYDYGYDENRDKQ